MSPRLADFEKTPAWLRADQFSRLREQVTEHGDERVRSPPGPDRERPIDMVQPERAAMS